MLFRSRQRGVHHKHDEGGAGPGGTGELGGTGPGGAGEGPAPGGQDAERHGSVGDISGGTGDFEKGRPIPQEGQGAIESIERIHEGTRQMVDGIECDHAQ